MSTRVYLTVPRQTMNQITGKGSHIGDGSVRIKNLRWCESGQLMCKQTNEYANLAQTMNIAIKQVAGQVVEIREQKVTF